MVKEKSRRTAAISIRFYETVALSFRAAVSLCLQSYDDLRGEGDIR